jgi:NTP pyrophosphatase (non-canonical NTP hydrolase)
MDLPEIPQQATVRDWQSYMAKLVKARGWDKASDLEIFLLLTEEVGELAKAYRRHRSLFSEAANLLDIAQRLDIDLEQALKDKELHNRKRQWS